MENENPSSEEKSPKKIHYYYNVGQKYLNESIKWYCLVHKDLLTEEEKKKLKEKWGIEVLD
jgi:hypothetical protein